MEKQGLGSSFADLVDLVQRLLAKDGCPWDREQTLKTLKPYLIEECYEVLESIDNNDPVSHCEELGDVLFQIVFQSALRQIEGSFNIDAVCNFVVTKMKKRHPHVFAGAKISSSEEVKKNWQSIKDQERAANHVPKRVLRGIPLHLPALMSAHLLGERAASVGFDWSDVQGVRSKILEEMTELDEAIAEGDLKQIEQELGDVFFTCVRLAGKLGLSAEESLRAANRKFIRRFEAMEDFVAEDGRDLKRMELAEQNQVWQKVKALEEAP